MVKIVAATVLLVVVLTGCTSLAEPRIETFTDEFTGNSYQELRLYTLDASWTAIRFRQSDRTSVMIFDLHAPDWYFIESMTTRVDGTFTTYEAVDNSRSVASGGRINAWVVFTVDLDSMARMATADDVVIRFDGDRDYDYTLTENDKVWLQRFIIE